MKPRAKAPLLCVEKFRECANGVEVERSGGSISKGIAGDLLCLGIPDRPDVADVAEPTRNFLKDSCGPLEESLLPKSERKGVGEEPFGAELGRSISASRNRGTGGAGAEISEPVARDKLLSLILWWDRCRLSKTLVGPLPATGYAPSHVSSDSPRRSRFGKNLT